MTPHLLSFVGTGNYEACRYRLGETSSEPVRYIQLALIELLEAFKEQGAKVSVFLTQQAREKHWEGQQDTPGERALYPSLKEKFQHISIQPISIPEGKSPQELWEIFRIMYDQIQEGDTLYVDITHSYRSLPMFGISLLSYARILKQFSLGGIYYGAIEALGALDTVKKLPPEERLAPVFDLTSVYTLMEWSTAVHLFLRTGIADELADCVSTYLKPVLSDQAKRNLEAIGEKKLAEKLNDFSMNLLTNRGEEIRKGELFFLIKRVFADLEGKNLNLKPLEPLLSLIGETIAPFRQRDIRNNYQAVEWCIKHGWIQQGITQLQETIITHMLELLKENQHDLPEKEKVAKRELVSSVFFSKNNPAAEGVYQDCLKKNPHLAKRIHDHRFCNVAALPFNKLRDPRNDINHGGFVENTTANRFKHQLESVLDELKQRYREEFKEDLY